MTDWKEYIWVLPIIGGGFTLISIATPVLYFSYMGESADLWMFGYWLGTRNLGKGWVNDIKINRNGILRARIAESPSPFLFCFIGVLISGIIALVAGGLGSRGNIRKRTTLVSGILIIVFSVLFLSYMDNHFELFSHPMLSFPNGEFEDVSLSVETRLGFIGPFIGSVFCLTGGLIRTEPRID